MSGKIKRIAFPLLCLTIFIVLSLVGMTNRNLIDDLRRQGKDYVAVTPTAQPKDGVDGRSAYQVWLDNGYKGSEIEFLAWLRGTSGRDGRDGRDAVATDGKDGKDGRDGRTPVKGVDYFDGVSIKGDKGDTGSTGAAGPSGANGRTPQLSCVLRWDETDPTVTRYFQAWKYTDEDNTAWRNLQRIPSQDRPPSSDCVDLRS